MPYNKSPIYKSVSAIAGASSFILICSMGSSLFNSQFWLFDVFANFRTQYLIVTIPVAILLLLVKRPIPASTLCILYAFNAWLALPHLNTKPAENTNNRAELSIVLINVNTKLGSPNRVAAYIQKEQPDLFVLQEINSAWTSELEELISQFPFHKVHTREDNFGIGIFSKLPLFDSEIKLFGDAALPSITTKVEVNSVEVRIIATHTLPPKNRLYAELRNNQLEAISKHVTNSTEPIILLGDLNATAFSHNSQEFLNTSQLIDSTGSFGIQPTWPSFCPALGIQIDHVLHSKDIYTVDKRIGFKVGSDHLPVYASLQIK